jgi:DNA recombination protein RmuC
VNAALLVVVALASLLVGAMLGFLIAQLRSARQIEAVRIELEAARVRLESSTRQESERIALLEESEARLRAAFDSLAGETLRSNSELFLTLAREALGRDQAIAQSSLKERETAIAQLVEPLRTALQKTEAQVESLERERRDAFSTLRTQIEALASGQSQLQRETRNLVTALRRPEVRGRWGELTLRRLVELAGMAEHCDFTEQLQVAGEEGALRPDLVVHMPESRNLVVDVKAPLDAYLEALEAVTEEGRALAMKRHGQQVETRVRQLSAKSYWSQFEHSPEFVVLFLPGDQFLSAALAERPDLLETALKQNVILATPSTLIALLKTVAYGWRQAAVAENAALIRELGQELYRRLGNFTGHLGRVGQRLNGAVEAFNAAVGSLERQVMPQARRFPELGVTPDAPLPQMEQIDHVARAVAGQMGLDAPLADSASDEDPHAESPEAGASRIDLSDAAAPGIAALGTATPSAASPGAATRGSASPAAATRGAATPSVDASSSDPQSALPYAEFKGEPAPRTGKTNARKA